MRALLIGRALLVLPQAATAQLLLPTPYLAFDNAAAGAARSPFRALSFRYFHLETFEDGALNTPVVTPALPGAWWLQWE